MGLGAQPDSRRVQEIVRAFQSGDLKQAEAGARKMVRRHPAHPFGSMMLAAICRKQGRHAEALPHLQKLVALTPGDAGAHLNLGNVLRDLGRPVDALRSYQAAQALQPALPRLALLMGGVAMDLGRWEEAIGHYRRALDQDGWQPESALNLGICLENTGRAGEALEHYRQAVAALPGDGRLWAALADVCHDLNRYADALEASTRAVAVAPGSRDAWINHGVILHDNGLLQASLDAFSRALALDTGSLLARSNRLFGLHFLGTPPDTFRSEALAYAAAARQGVVPYTDWPVRDAGPLRVGLLSGDLRSHPVGYFLRALLPHLDGARLSLHVFSNAPVRDTVSEELQAHVAEWVEVLPLNDEQLAARIRESRIHVLLDLSGHTAHNRLPVLVRRPAPVQLSWLGYFATTGLAEVDGVIVDPVSVPEDSPEWFAETRLALPATRLCFAPPGVELAVGEPPCLEHGRVTFGCFSNLRKISDPVLANWGTLLATLPDSRLILMAKQFHDPGLVAAFRDRATQAGLDPTRLELRPPVAREAYYQAYREVDVMLDTWPYPGGTTTVDALWMGVPVLTLSGDRMLARQGESLLAAAGLDDWVARTPEDWVRRGTRLASDPAALAALRAGLRQRMLASPLMDAAGFARHWTDLVEGAWRRWGAAWVESCPEGDRGGLD